MTNAELIKALRYCISDNADDCYLCPYQSYCKSNGTGQGKMIRDAADALEAAEKRIKELESQAAFFDAEKLNYQENIEYRDERIKELVARMPKEGEWIEANTRPRSAQFYCSICHRTCYDIQPTRDKAYTKRCRYHYCPNCGARMQTVTNCHTLEEGER